MNEEQDRTDASSEGNGRRSILMFAYYFPPCVCWPTASMRPEGLATGLVRKGWDPIVVTRRNGCACLENGSLPALTDGALESGIEIRRVEVRPSIVVRASIASERWRKAGLLGRVGYRLFKPIRKARRLTEIRDNWPGRALAEGKTLMRRRDVHAVWTTSGPYLSIGIGRSLQRRHRTPWVADLRDSIARERAWPDLLARIAGHHLRRRWYRTLDKASAVVGVTPQEAAIDSRALGLKVHPIPSGFDLSTWAPLRRAGTQTDRDERFHILYTGAFYGALTEQGDIFFKGLRRFISSSRPQVSFTYLGRYGRGCISAANENDCGLIAEIGGMVSPAEARVAMTRADLLLLLSPATVEGGMPGGKLYEYLAAGPPILAVPGTDEYVMQILRELQAGDGATTPDDIAELLAHRYQDWRLGRVAARPLDELTSFSWSSRAHQLADLLDSLVAPEGRRNDLVDPIEGVLT